VQIPDTRHALKKKAWETIEICRHSIGSRQARCRQLRQWIETGRANGDKSLHNRLYSHNDRLQSYLFSPSDLRFSIDFENHYPKEMLLKAEMASRILSREWERNNIDIMFGEGVKMALDYGACAIKAIARKTDDQLKIESRLVMPWMLGVYDESLGTLSDQEAICEVAYLTLPQAWRRIAHLPDAEKMFIKIKALASTNTEGDSISAFHQVLSTGTLQTSLTNTTSPLPGGIVDLGNNSSDVIISPDTGAQTVKFYELWMWDDMACDWVTVQMFGEDILVAPLFKKSNLFCPDTLPYTLIQPNTTAGYIWGRPEIADLVEPQGLLSEWLDDYRRMMGVQFDKLLAFIGNNTITDELYDEFRGNGYVGLEQGSDVKDLTPKIPEQALEAIKMLIEFMEETGGFSNILSGQGEPGVRAGNHAQTLLKTASPRMRDRAILVERQAASFGDVVLSALEAKSDKIYSAQQLTDSQEGDFLLSQLPDDRRVSVDSHSSSPIYEDDHKEMAAFLFKNQVIDGESVLDLLPVPDRDLLKLRFKEMQAQKQKMLEQHPELLTKGKGHK
jgi:hypothetical protein